MMVIFGSLSGVYVIPTIYEDYASLEHAAKNRNSVVSDKASLDDSSMPRRATNVDDFARNSIKDVYNKAKELKANSSVVSSVVIFFFFFFVCV